MNGYASQCITELCPGSESSSSVLCFAGMKPSVSVFLGCVQNAVRQGGAFARMNVKQGVAAKARQMDVIKVECAHSQMWDAWL